jgi:hypothetical protein
VLCMCQMRLGLASLNERPFLGQSCQGCAWVVRQRGPFRIGLSLSNLAMDRGRSLSSAIFVYVCTTGYHRPTETLSRTSYGERMKLKFRYWEADGRAPDRDHRSVVVGCQRRVLRRI